MIKFELSEQMVNVIAQALGNTTYNVAAPVIAEMQKQIDEQRKLDELKQKQQLNGNSDKEKSCNAESLS